jgi:hypothetical protein
MYVHGRGTGKGRTFTVYSEVLGGGLGTHGGRGACALSMARPSLNQDV